MDYRAVEADLRGFDACFFCLGVSSAGMDEAHYTRLTYDLTLAAAEVLARLNPQMTFVYVSGVGTDSTRARLQHVGARQRAHRERAAAPALQGGLPVPTRRDPAAARRALEDARVRGDVRARRMVAAAAASDVSAAILTTESVGQAMLAVARRGAPQAVLEPGDIYDAARGG